MRKEPPSLANQDWWQQAQHKEALAHPIRHHGRTKRVDDGVHIAEVFTKFFTDKINAVRAKTSFMPLQDVPVTAKQVSNKWTVVKPEQIGNLIGSTLSKMCQLDPALTWLVKLYCRHSSLCFSTSPLQLGVFWKNIIMQSSHHCWRKATLMLVY